VDVEPSTIETTARPATMTTANTTEGTLAATEAAARRDQMAIAEMAATNSGASREPSTPFHPGNRMGGAICSAHSIFSLNAVSR
jgi:hypothetical protein